MLSSQEAVEEEIEMEVVEVRWISFICYGRNTGGGGSLETA